MPLPPHPCMNFLTYACADGQVPSGDQEIQAKEKVAS